MNFITTNESYLETIPMRINLYKKQIKMVSCNDSVIHAITGIDNIQLSLNFQLENGELYTWGNDPEKLGTMGIGSRFHTDQPMKVKFETYGCGNH